MNTSVRSFGDLLRGWRQRRRWSQLDLACRADISTRHLSFLETGRSSPSRDMVLHLAEYLAVPLRERNVLLTAAGYAPVFGERGLDDPALAAARQAVEQVVKGHEPFPAIAIDRYWTLVTSNGVATRLLCGVDPPLLRPPVNVLRLSLHPAGLAPRIANFREWRAHLLARLGHQIDATADAALVELLRELRDYPVPDGGEAGASAPGTAHAGVVVPLRLVTSLGVLSFISTTTVFGTPLDITLAELALEAFYPADAATGEALRTLAATPPPAR
jgi:transcriptional regulator with XRE-family HTH domain